jgi:DNA circularisation protein N-terminus
MLNSVSPPSTAPGLPNNSNQAGTVLSGFPPLNNNASPQALSANTSPDWAGKLLTTAIFSDGDTGPVYFPSLVFKEEQSNALAIHTYPNLDSGRVENMGRNPARWIVRAILTNDIWPGPGEQWVPGTLFPTVFYALLNVLLNNNDKTFVHPIYGNVTCQVEHWTYELNPKGPRDGAIVEFILVETIGSDNTLASLLPAPPASGLAAASNALDTLIEDADGDDADPLSSAGAFSSFGLSVSFGLNFGLSINIPGIDLTGFFPAISVQIQSSLAYPNNVVEPLNQNILSVNENVSGSIAATPAYIVSKTNSNLQAFKGPVLGSTVYNPNNPFMDQSTYSAMQSIVALNNTPSQNCFQLIDKAMTATVSLQQHYLNQNNSAAAPIIEALRQQLLQLQQIQSSLSLNATNQALNVSTYVTTTNISWYELASYLNQDIDDLMALNQGLIYDFFVPAFTNINYYQA